MRRFGCFLLLLMSFLCIAAAESKEEIILTAYGFLVPLDNDTVEVQQVFCSGNDQFNLQAAMDCWEQDYGLRVVKLAEGSIKDCMSEEIDLPEGVEEIGVGAICDCPNLKTLELSDSVVRVDGNPFSNCDAVIEIVLHDNPVLEYSNGLLINNETKTVLFAAYDEEQSMVEIPDGVICIARNAFRGNNCITEVILPDTVTTIADCAFEDCGALRSIVFSRNLKSIGIGAFSGCERLGQIALPDGLEEIGDEAFSHCYALTSVIFPDTLQTIGKRAFLDCESLTDIDFGKGVRYLGAEAFSTCFALKNVVLPEKLTELEWRTFASCVLLETVSIPAELTRIAEEAFANCPETLCLISFTSDLK